MRLHQSDLALWYRCPLQWRFANIDELPRTQSSALTFGTIIHAAVEAMEIAQDLDVGLERFTAWWSDPASLDPELEITLWLPGPSRSYRAYLDKGLRILRDWWGLYQWSTDVVVVREHPFVVPVGPHELAGRIDKLLLRSLPDGKTAVVVSDNKTGALPDGGSAGLEWNHQLIAYSLASCLPSFWEDVPDGPQMFERYRDAPRLGEWLALEHGPRRITTTPRTEQHYNRLRYAISQVAESIQLGIFPPTLTNRTCSTCEFRLPCGLEPLEQGTGSLALAWG